MTVADTYRAIIARLRPRFGAGEARAMADLIFHAQKGWGRTGILMHDDQEVSDLMHRSVDGMVSRIERGEPVQYVTGEAYFHGLWLKSDSRALIPRPETSELVDIISDDFRGRRDLRILDVGAGSGCIALALSRALPFCEVKGIDISPEALALARDNARRLDAEVAFEEADMRDFHPEPDSLDIVVSNPPYIDESEKGDMDITVTGYEPSEALFVPDSDPLCFYRPVVRIAMEALRPGGRLYLEINPRHSGDILRLLETAGMANGELCRDIHGKERFAMAEKPVMR